MRRYLPFTKIKYLPPILPEDHEFAHNIADKYKLPENELYWMVRDIRNNLQNTEFYEYLNEDYDKKYYRKLKTQNLKTDDPLFVTFNKSMDRIKSAIEKQKDKDFKFVDKKILKQSVFLKLMIYFRQSDLNIYNKHIAIGMFLVYFKLWPFENKPYKTELEYNANPSTIAETWEEYLYNLVRSRKKRFCSEIIL